MTSYDEDYHTKIYPNLPSAPVEDGDESQSV